ncbi:uncharacterized protein LOC113771541 [Coffea eugenioides]|uniref:uncharacterized protein LOC113771541 n=1 Tax=Coffea eugenioides TaxID=49369 RepID=UPI000F613DDB|nr:uncharacterized protein LOC113771541 [Coffea eugenioides]
MDRRGRGRGCGRGFRQPRTPERGEGSTIGPNQNPRNEEGDQVATAINRMTDILERLAERQGPEPVNQPGNQKRGEDRALERFLKFTPPKFHGGSDPEVAKNWFERMVDIFAALDYTEERQVNFAVFQFEGAARSWWNVVSAKWERKQTPWTWRFTKFFKFAPELVVTERKRIRRCIQGLNVKIQESLAAAQIATFTDALDKAQRVENAKSQSKAFHARKRGNPSDTPKSSEKSTQPLDMRKGAGEVRMHDKPGETPSSEALPKGNQSKRGQQKRKSQTSQVVTPHITCAYCGKINHTEAEYWRKQEKCLRCGSTKHKFLNCPKVSKGEGNSQQPAKSTANQSSAGRNN